MEIYKGKPVFYGLGSFSFHTGHRGQHGDWLGMLARVKFNGRDYAGASFEFVRHNDRNETVICDLSREQPALEALRKSSARYKTAISVDGNNAVLHAA